MTLNKRLQQQLKARAHSLKPVVMLGAKGLTQAVIDEVEVALKAHELIKVKLPQSDKNQRRETSDNIAQSTQSQVIQIVGNTLVLYRENPEKTK